MGGALGLAVLTSLAAALTNDYADAHDVAALSGSALVHGYQGAFLTGALLAFVGAVASVLLLPSPHMAPA
jgi:hypothetical protein